MNNGKGIIKKETLDPGTAAEDGRRKIRANSKHSRMPWKNIQDNGAKFYVHRTRNGTASATAPVRVVFITNEHESK